MEDSFSPRKLVVIIVEIILVVMLALTAVALVQLYWVTPVGISGPSMEATLFSGDTVYVRKNAKTYEREDVVVLYLPSDYNNYALDWGRYTGDNDDTERCPSSRKKTFDDFFAAMPFFGKSQTHDESGDEVTIENSYKMVIKRIVGVPGDHVQIESGVLKINGAIEKRAGLYNFPVDYDHVLGEGEYYILGDNRRVSRDSSEYGPVKGSWIYGKVFAAHTDGSFKSKL